MTWIGSEMKSLKACGKALALGLLCATLSQVAASAATPDRKDALDEIVVESTRARLNKMLQEMVQLEDRFFDRYNELNTNDDFDMHCFSEARVGTRLNRRYCRAEYMSKALETEGRDYLRALPSYTDPTAAAWAPPLPAIMMIEARRKEYQQNMREVTRRNPELVRLLRERYELGKRYEATRRKVWGLKSMPEEQEAVPAAPQD